MLFTFNVCGKTSRERILTKDIHVDIRIENNYFNYFDYMRCLFKNFGHTLWYKLSNFPFEKNFGPKRGKYK